MTHFRKDAANAIQYAVYMIVDASAVVVVEFPCDRSVFPDEEFWLIANNLEREIRDPRLPHDAAIPSRKSTRLCDCVE